MTSKHIFPFTLRAIALWPLLAVSLPAHASSETVVFKFKTTDGALPDSSLSGDSSGNGYGATRLGGVYGDGTVYRITPTGQETILHSFSGSPNDGSGPDAGVTQAKDGNFYGTTYNGGAYGTSLGGYGTVYKITPTGQEIVLHAFTRSNGDGAYPMAGLIQGKDGNFYGTTSMGGTYDNGTVYKITPTGQETVMYSFTRSNGDGAYPYAGVIQATDGNFYGTTVNGGAFGTYGYGTVYKITPSGQETIIYSFQGGLDGEYPHAALLQSKDGNFYGTTQNGGSYSTDGYGTVFKVTPAGQEMVLHSFTGFPNDGYDPTAGLIEGKDSNFYGTTYYGGAYGTFGYGTVYKITSTGQETILWSFMGVTRGDGANPSAPLVQDRTGYLYGTTQNGGTYGDGTIFRIIL